MPSYAEQIEANVQRLVSEGAIPAGMEAEYVKLFTNNPKAQERFATVLSMDRDYTQKSQANAQWRREQDQQLAQERQRIQAEEQRLRQWETQANAEIQRLQAERMTPETAARLAALETVVANYNLGEAVTVPPVVQRPPVQPTIPPPQGAAMPANDNNYLSREEGVGAIRDLTSIYSQALMVSNEHFALFGKPLTDDLVTESINTGRPVRELYEAKHNPAGRRAELEQQNRAAQEAALRAKIEEEVMAKYAVDPSRLGQGFGQPPGAPQNQFFELAASRAQIDLATGKPVAAAPEAIPAGQLQAARVNKALDYFNKNYTPDGTPRKVGGPAQSF